MPRAWNTLACVLLLAALLFLLFTFRDYGLSWDEEHAAQNGELAAAWYRTLGHDSRIISKYHVYYGTAFNLASHLVSRVSPLGRYETQHLLIALVAWVGLLFTFRLARLAGGDRAGFFALLFLVLTPVWVGHGFMNATDIPLAALYAVAGYYLVRAVTELPEPSRATLVGLAVASGLAAGIRVIGILVVVGYWGLALGVWWLAAIVRKRPRPPWWRVAVWWGAPALAAWSIMVLFWPVVQRDPFRRPVRAFSAMAYNWFSGPILFEGSMYPAQALPWWYLPTWFSISLPEFYACGLAAGLVAALAFVAKGMRGPRARTAGIAVLIGLLAFLAPLLAILRRSPVYDGMRHFLFVLPFLAVLAGWGFATAVGELQALWRRRVPVRGLGLVRGALALLLVAGGLVSIGLTVADLRALHPYEYIYFNRLVAGGQVYASTRFETDYWGLSYKEGIDWLRDNYPATPEPVTVANCSVDFQTAYWIESSPELAARFEPVSAVSIPPPRIFLATTRNACHRRGGTPIHVVERAGVPLMYVLERTNSGWTAPAAPSRAGALAVTKPR